MSTEGSRPMGRREPSGEETERLRRAVRDAAWSHARTLADLSREQGPFSTYDWDLPGMPGWRPEARDAQLGAELALLSALRDARTAIEEAIADCVSAAGQLDAGGPAIASALGISKQAVAKRYRHAVPRRPGPRPAGGPSGRSIAEIEATLFGPYVGATVRRVSTDRATQDPAEIGIVLEPQPGDWSSGGPSVCRVEFRAGTQELIPMKELTTRFAPPPEEP